MILRVLFSYLMLALWLSGGFASAQTAHDDVSVGAHKIDIATIDSRLNRLMTERGMVGLGVVIVEGGELIHSKGYGVTLAGSSDAVTDETVFRWASVSKGVAGTLMAKLEEEGLLSLSDPASYHAKSLRLPEQGEHQANVRHVLTHQLGIIRNAYDNRLEGGANPYAIRAALSGLELQCDIGTCHGYQNVAFDSSSEIIEAVTGMSYKDAVQHYLFGPLGMNSLAMSVEELQYSPRWARPHNATGYNVYRRMRESYFRIPAAGGVSTNIRDLGLWMRAQMGQAPHVLSEAVLETVHTPYVETLRERNRVKTYYPWMQSADYGLGWRIYDYAGHKVIGHRGAVNGYRALILFDPVLDVGVAALWNSGSNQPVGLQMEVMDMAYGLPARDWLYLDGGPNLPQVKRLAAKYTPQSEPADVPENVPVPRMSPETSQIGLPADHGHPLYMLSNCYAF